MYHRCPTNTQQVGTAAVSGCVAHICQNISRNSCTCNTFLYLIFEVSPNTMNYVLDGVEVVLYLNRGSVAFQSLQIAAVLRSGKLPKQEVTDIRESECWVLLHFPVIHGVCLRIISCFFFFLTCCGVLVLVREVLCVYVDLFFIVAKISVRGQGKNEEREDVFNLVHPFDFFSSSATRRPRVSLQKRRPKSNVRQCA